MAWFKGRALASAGLLYCLTTQTSAQSQSEQTIYSDVFDEVKSWLDAKQMQLQNNAFASYDSNGAPYLSNTYSYDDFIRVLESMSVSGVGGGGKELRFYLGADGKGSLYGLVNVAAFLAQAMAISIKYDVCDEFHVDDYSGTGLLAISNSCGQYGRNNQDEVCTGKQRSMTCDVDINATITAVSTFKNGNPIPPAFQCRPKKNSEDFAGYWDSKTGEIEIGAFANRYGRTDLQGCCWWGRGVMMTRGACGFGKINHYLGVNAISMGYVNFYDVDFCSYPEVVCNSPYSKDLRWAVGYFEWIDKVQTFNGTRNYMDELDNLIESRFNETDAEQFIDIVGFALPVSCPQASWQCDPSVDRRLIDERRENFMTLINALALEDLLPEETTSSTTTEATTTFAVAVSLGNGGTNIGAPSDDIFANETNSSSVPEPQIIWYPVMYASNFEAGICVSLSPTPPNEPMYQSELECCVEFFNDQVKGKCLSQIQTTDAPVNSMPIESLPRNPSKKPTPQPTKRPTEDPTFQPTIELIELPSSGHALEEHIAFTIGCVVLSVLLGVY